MKFTHEPSRAKHDSVVHVNTSIEKGIHRHSPRIAQEFHNLFVCRHIINKNAGTRGVQDRLVSSVRQCHGLRSGESVLLAKHRRSHDGRVHAKLEGDLTVFRSVFQDIL